jgi:hypothetical protein
MSTGLIGGTFTAEECREIVKKAIAMGTMSYPGGGTEPPTYAPFVSSPIRRAASMGISVEEYREIEKRRQYERRKRRDRLFTMEAHR